MTDTLRMFEAASRTGAMSRDEKVAFLHAHRWRRADGNRWRSRNGDVASFANAVRLQILADLERGK